MESTLKTVKHLINLVLSRVAAAMLLIMTLLVLWQVFSRYVLNNPSDFTEELVRYFLIWTGFIGAAYAFGSRQHMALIFVRDRLSPGAKRIVMAITDALILAFALIVIVFAGTQLALSARVEVSALLGISRGLVYAVAPISGVFIVIVQLLNIYEDLTGIALDDPQEVQA